MKKNVKIGEIIHPMETDDEYLNLSGYVFEPDMVEMMTCLIDPQDTVLDVGANIGMTSLLFSRISSHVIAFEAAPTTYDILVKNLERSGIKNVDFRNVGLGAEPGTLTLTYGSNNRGGGFVSDKVKLETGYTTENINIITLDSMIDSFKDGTYFIKIDVEGFEKYVIQGGRRFIDLYKPTVVMEMNHFCLDVLHRITLPDFLDYMRSVFPFLYAIDNDNSVIADLHNPVDAYMVMHENAVNSRFYNIVGGFKSEIGDKLIQLSQTAVNNKDKLELRNSMVNNDIEDGRASITVVSPIPESVRPGHLMVFRVKLQNRGAQSWVSYGEHPVFLSYHWKTVDGEDLIADGVRTALRDGALDPGAWTEQDMSIIAPEYSGSAQLIISLVQEGISWFEARGLEPVTVDILIE